MTKEKTLEQFKYYLWKKRLSPQTVKTYHYSAYTYLNIYRKVSAENICAFQRYLENNYSPKSVNVYIVGFNRFLHFIGKDDLRLRLSKCRQASYLEDVVSCKEYQYFKKNLAKLPDKRWYFVVWTLAATGVRISELVQFHVEDIRRGSIDVRAKGNKIRRVFITRRLQSELLKWLDGEGIAAGAVFQTAQNKPISIRGITKGIERVAKMFNIDPHRVHPHAFRHLFAKMFLQKSGDLATLADLLGHESLDTTKIYLRRTLQEQKNLIDEIVEW